MAKQKQRTRAQFVKRRRTPGAVSHGKADSARPASGALHSARPASGALHSARPAAIGGSVAAQAAHLADPRWRGAQRLALTDQIGRTQGNRHVQQVVDTLQVLRKEEKAFTKQEVRDVLNAILGLEWMSQSGGKQPIQLTPRLIAIIQTAASLSAEDLGLLWQKAPRTPGEALQNLDHSLPDTVAASVMDKLQSAKLGLITFGGKPTGKGEEQGAPASPGQKPEVVSGIEGKEELFKAIVGALQGKGPEDKSQGTEALKKSLEAFFETEQGKKVKERSLELLLGSKGLPFTALIASAGLAAMVANNTDIPSTPEIPLSDNLSLKVEFEGTFQQPKGIKFVCKFTFGGPAKQEGKKQSGVLELPPDLRAIIGRIDRNTLIQWFVKQAYADYEMAGPQEEEAKKRFYIAARDRPQALGLPDAQAVAEAIARKLLEAAIQNRLNQLKGTEVQKRVEFDMGHAEQWNHFPQLAGLAARLEWLLGLLVPKVPYKALGIEEVAFACGSKLIPVKVKK